MFKKMHQAIAIGALAGLLGTVGQAAVTGAAKDGGHATAADAEMAKAGIKVVHVGKRIIYMIPTTLPEKPYQIGPSDVLQIDVWENAQLSQSVTVRPDGSLSLPLVGDLHAEGMTVPQLREDLTRRLAKFIRNPVVTVTVKDPRSHSYNVLGQVMHPGAYTIERPTRVLDALAKAGGFQDFAKKNSIYVLRRVPGGPEVRVYFQYDKVIQGLRSNENVQLQKGDVVVVP